MYEPRSEGSKVLFATYDSTSKEFLSKIFANFGFSSFKCCQIGENSNLEESPLSLLPCDPTLGTLALKLSMAKTD